MSFNSEYLELRKKRKEREQEKLNEISVKKQNINTQTEKKLDFFQKGSFEDGYQAGDVTKAILGTVGDAGLSFVRGLSNLGEGLLDTVGYAAAGVADLLGKDGWADDIKRHTQDSLTDEMFYIPNEAVEDKSILGRTSRAIVGGVGQVAGVVSTANVGGALGLGKTGVNVLTTTMNGLSGLGSGMSEAYQGGATDEEAVTNGLISAASDVITEMLWGGLGKGSNAIGIGTGLSSADDMLAKKVSSMFSSQIAKNISEFGVKAGAEGVEEVLAGVLQAVGKKITYMSEEDLKKILDDENLLEQFVVGMASSGFAQAGDLHNSNKTKTDFITGLSQNEQAVFDKVYNDRLAEAKEGGKKVSGKKKSEIYNSVMNDIEKGYVGIDTIESVLGGETYKQYQSAVEKDNQMKELQKEYDSLYKMKNGEKSDEQIDRQKALKQQLEEYKNTSNMSQLKEQLSNEVSELAKTTKLNESYNEKSRRSQAFEADLSKYDAKAQETVKRAIDSGILNNTNRTHEFVDLVAKLSADKGVLFDFTDNAKIKETGFAIDGKQVNGYVQGNNIAININSTSALNKVVGHEITHIFEGTELYNELANAVKQYATTKGEYDSKLQSITKLYEGIEDANIENELTADLIGEYLFTDSDFINRLSAENPTLFQKIFDEIKYLCKVATAGSKEARQLEKVKKTFEEAYRQKNNTATDGGVDSTNIKFSLELNNYPYNMQTVIKDYISSVDSELYDMVEKTKSEDKSSFERHTIGEVSQNLIDDISSQLNIDVTNYSNAINSNAIQHIIKRHGENGEADSSMSNSNDIARVGYIVDNYDSFEILTDKDGNIEYSEEFRNADNSKAPMIKLSKKINGTYYVVEAVPESKYKKIWVVSAYINKSSGVTQAPNNSGSSLASPSSANNIISNPTEDVKKKQLEIINKYNPAPNTYNTWVRSVEDIKTFEEALADDEIAEYDEFNPDFDRAMAEQAIKDGEITVYSSYPIKQGVFVSPSYMEAESYSGDGTVYSKRVPLDSVAWIDITQGQYADTKTDNTKMSLSNTNDDIAPVGKENSKSDSLGRELSAEQVEFFKNAKTRDENGNLKPFYHGTGRADRVGNVFRADRATAGPMAYFTDSKNIADNYAKDKKDTSIDYDSNYDSYEEQFRVIRNGKDINIIDLWKTLSVVERNEIIEKAKHITLDDDFENVIYSEETQNGLGNFDTHEINAHKGNVLHTLVDSWLTAGNIYGEEHKFLDVLKLLGIDDVKYMDPNFRAEKTYQVYLNITNPFNTSNISSEMLEVLRKASKTAEHTIGNIANLWDKRNITPERWIELLEDDINNGTTYVWTRIPDFVTDTLKSYGYDGILDTGGKGGGAIHEVAIPFYSNQIKNVDNLNPTTNDDIRYSLTDNNDIAPVENGNVYGEDIKLQSTSAEDIAPIGENVAPGTEAVENTLPDDFAPTEEDIKKQDTPKIDLFVKPKKAEAEQTATPEDVAPVEQSAETTETVEEKPKSKRLERAVRKIDTQLEQDKADLSEDFQQKKAELEKALENKTSFVSDKALSLYKEIQNLRKGVRASNDLGYFLDLGFEWKDLKSTLLKVSKWPDTVLNAESEIESIVREAIGRDFEEKFYELDDLDTEYQKQIEELEKKAEEKRKKAGVAEQRRVKQQEYKTQMDELIGDTSTWKDKKLGVQYQINTLRRNLRDIVQDKNGKRDLAKADAIYDELQGQYNHNEAELNREANRIKQVYAEMNINQVEDQYIQMLGEYRHNPDTKLTLEEMQEFLEKNKDKIDEAKVDKIIDLARGTYDSLFGRVNANLKEQGMREIPYRLGYFPHFTEEKQGRLAKLLNWKTHKTDIPTDIAGLTEQFNPNRSWQSFNKQRSGDDTDYSFMKGLDTYVQGALDWIYHIEDIQKRRAFENHIRYVHSEKGIQERIDAIYNNEEYDADEMQEQVDAVFKEAGNPLNNFVTDFRTQTNTLAGKKSSMDRNMEAMLSRDVYSTMTNISNRVTANMVVGSVSSALTNFIPITQSWGQVSPISSLRAMKDTIKSTIQDDGTIDKSDFLTNRLKKSENLYKTTWDKVIDKAGFMMEAIDSFTSQTVWRSKYLENVSKGMGENEAIKDADQFAENVLAGRSRGNNPTIFDSKNPLIKTMTAFQLEVNNQYGYMFKDMPQDMKNESVAKLVKGYATMFIGAYAYNAAYSALTGRDAAFDPIGIIQELLQDLFDDEEDEPADVIMDFTDNIIDELPFVGGILGDGGRVPLSSALPYGGIREAWEGSVTDFTNGNYEDLTEEWLFSVGAYGLAPMGGGQIKKTVQGLSMFDDDLPIAGSYTDSGKLRFTVDDAPLNIAQAAVFGQYSSDTARQYFDEERAPLSDKKTQELIDLDISIEEYWEYQDGLKALGEDATLAEKVDYIADLEEFDTWQKNIMANNLTDRKEPIDLTGYEDIGDFEEFDYATKNPGKYAVAKSVGGYSEYIEYSEHLNNITSEKDANGNTISGSRKTKVANYINNLDIEYGEKIILYRSQYKSDDTYNYEIVEYLNGRDDISREEMETILTELGFTVYADGRVTW